MQKKDKLSTKSNFPSIKSIQQFFCGLGRNQVTFTIKQEQTKIPYNARSVSEAFPFIIYYEGNIFQRITYLRSYPPTGSGDQTLLYIDCIHHNVWTSLASVSVMVINICLEHQKSDIFIYKKKSKKLIMLTTQITSILTILANRLSLHMFMFDKLQIITYFK